MITVKISESPDLIVCNEFLFHKNLITIGSQKCDINIEDKDILPHHLSIEITADKKLIIQPAKNIKNYLINGKLTTQKSILSKMQTISIGSTIILITQYEFKKEIDIKHLRDQKLIELSKNKDQKWDLLEQLRSNLE